MSAREEILGRVRSALAAADPSLAPVPRGYRSVVPAGDVVELFAERLVDYRAELTRCTADTLPAALASALGDAGSVLVPDGFPWEVPGGVPDTGQSAAELDRLDAVVTLAALAIATTGTIVLDHGPGQGRRAVSLVPDRHVCVLRTDQIVPGVPQAVAALSPDRPQTWISGPSATSDIELNRVEGVHGPRTLHVLLVSS
ncbi:LutC/YkgG family protein [Amycolatopsis thermoflava]|uniref:L-lactate dehydrogenase complex protein LldG n=1 Tax=Amycolatopsis thermoflava TaxID=84480 RepID=A0A3N2GQZ3_9PSEU|nr:lactate utilization protein C [Amycolatopsis thermoflava]ROS38943.1 L-lactate dehydrogenase complex protein LldG [Amycolatopsis thermoflava]